MQEEGSSTVSPWRWKAKSEEDTWRTKEESGQWWSNDQEWWRDAAGKWHRSQDKAMAWGG